MNPQTLVTSLREGYIEQYAIDLGTKTFTMTVAVLAGSVLSTYDVVFRDMSYFCFVDKDGGRRSVHTLIRNKS